MLGTIAGDEQDGLVHNTASPDQQVHVVGHLDVLPDPALGLEETDHGVTRGDLACTRGESAQALARHPTRGPQVHPGFCTGLMSTARPFARGEAMGGALIWSSRRQL